MSLQANPHNLPPSGNHGMPGHGGSDGSLFFAIGDQFMISLVDPSYWLSTVHNFLDELSDMDTYEDFTILQYAVSSTLSSFSSAASESTTATSLFTIADEDLPQVLIAPAPTPVLATAPVAAFPGIGAIGPAVGGDGLPYSIRRMLSETRTEMPWSAALLYTFFDEV